MQHLDDGMLHAYLDGELGEDAAEPADVQRSEAADDRNTDECHEQIAWRAAEQHLAECTECRARLEAARQIREGASTILAGSGPAGVSMPSFEELRARAKARDGTLDIQPGLKTEVRTGTLRQLRSLAWAATVVLAAAVGWYARSAVLSSNHDRSVSERESRDRLTVQVPPTDGSVTGTEVDPSGRRSQSDLDDSPQRATFTDQTDRFAEDVPEDVSAGGVEAVEGNAGGSREEQALEIARFQAAAPNLSEAVGASGVRATEPTATLEQPREADEVVAEPTSVPESPLRTTRVDSAERISSTVAAQLEERDERMAPRLRGASAADAAPAPVATQIASGQGGRVESEWTNVDEATAAAILEQPVPKIEGLAVVDFATSWVDGRQAVRVRQSLDSGDIVDLIVGDADTALPTASEKKGTDLEIVTSGGDSGSVNSIVVRHGGFSVRLSAPLTMDSLRALSEAIGRGG